MRMFNDANADGTATTPCTALKPGPYVDQPGIVKVSDGISVIGVEVQIFRTIFEKKNWMRFRDMFGFFIVQQLSSPFS